ncbi:MAG: addiction module antitoxin RelB [Elusimicrobia bacterium CG03_land_8_20_14_0_80_50_18]|nr:MAG: addiction module antitoxin RelB [Elusimicrobia bacterium CG03_land_8_20_14_0_80_50_18]
MEGKMNKVVEKIVAQALQAPPKDRAVIAEQLIASLDAATDLDVEVAWQEEIQKRVGEVDKGDIDCIPWEAVRERLRGNAVVEGV